MQGVGSWSCLALEIDGGSGRERILPAFKRLKPEIPGICFVGAGGRDFALYSSSAFFQVVSVTFYKLLLCGAFSPLSETREE